MTVGELIDELSKHDRATLVVMPWDTEQESGYRPVKNVFISGGLYSGHFDDIINDELNNRVCKDGVPCVVVS